MQIDSFPDIVLFNLMEVYKLLGVTLFLHSENKAIKTIILVSLIAWELHGLIKNHSKSNVLWILEPCWILRRL